MLSDLRNKHGTRGDCPIFSIQYDIARIKQIQKIFKYRGGVFLSKYTNLRGSYTTSPNKIRIHRVLVKQWTVTKVILLNRITHYETVLSDLKADAEKGVETSREAISALEEALRLWEIEKETCSTLPGVKYLSTSTWLNLREFLVTKTKEIKSQFKVKSKPTPHIPAANTSKSILRKPSSFRNTAHATSDFTPVSPLRKTRFNDLVEHSPDHLNTVSPDTAECPHDRLSVEPTLHPHNAYTDPESATHKRIYQRSNHNSYSPGTWASQEGWFKVNTSLCTVEWGEAENMWKWEVTERKSGMWTSMIYIGVVIAAVVCEGLLLLRGGF